MGNSNYEKGKESQIEETSQDKEYLNECYTKNSSIVSRTVAGEVILVPIRKKAGDLKSVYTLNKTGARMWELLDGKRKIEDVKQMIVQEYDVSAKKAEKDILKLIEQLKTIGAVYLSEESGSDQRS